MCNSYELILRLYEEEAEYVHLALVVFAVRGFVDAHQEPHAEHIKNNMHVTHELFSHIKVRNPVKEAINIQARGRVLDRPGVPDELAIVVRFLHVYF